MNNWLPELWRKELNKFMQPGYLELVIKASELFDIAYQHASWETRRAMKRPRGDHIHIHIGATHEREPNAT